MEPLVFQRRDSSAVRLVPGTLEMFLAESVMSLKSSLAGRELTRSSRCSSQLVAVTLVTEPLHWFVLLSSIATALVTERSRNKIPPGAFVADSAGWESSTTLMALFVARLKKSFAPMAITEFTVAWRLSKSTPAPVTLNSGSSTMLLLSPGWPSLKSRNANAVSFTAATRLVAFSSKRYFKSIAMEPPRISKRTKS